MKTIMRYLPGIIVVAILECILIIVRYYETAVAVSFTFALFLSLKIQFKRELEMKDSVIESLREEVGFLRRENAKPKHEHSRSYQSSIYDS
ncbi:MAG: hypothetical protein EXS48_03660 [Candidatus Staskawiczbacteria bacterium]|nr:hypothetical protein [Candidatus Staskawiczbacteria bacterium]